MADFPFIDSGQHYNTREVATRSKWTVWNRFAYSATGGRDGNPSYTGDRYKTFLVEQNTLTMGQAWYFNGLSGFLMRGINLAMHNGTEMAELYHVGDGRLQVALVGSPFVTAIVNNFVAAQNKWYFIECQFILGSSGGYPTLTWEVHVDNNPVDSGVLTGTALLTSLQWDRITFGSVWANIAVGSDNPNCDFYLNNTTEFFGDTACRAFWPRSDQTYTAGVPSSAGAHYLMVREHIPDDGTTTLTLAAVGDKDSYFMDNIAGFTVVKAAQFLWLVNKTDAGLSSFKGLLRSSGADVLTREFFPNEHNFLYFIESYRNSPHTSTDWTISELNAQEVGEDRIT